ncbi:MAG: response regulator transcription factor [Campylobacteraceae bacterium]|nr:response regulator transcription factor [Campylobacteraceae bacterium]
MINVLMIEDDKEFAQLLGEYLAEYNIKVTNYENPYLGLSTGIRSYDLLILDLTLPGVDGLEICKEISEQYSTPIMISSGRGDITDKVIGLQMGADDYLVKPYDPKEMYARIVSLVRRHKKISKEMSEASAVINTKVDDIAIMRFKADEATTRFKVDDRRHQISFDDKPLTLTLAEYGVLSYLIAQHGFSVTREQIVYNCKFLRNKESKSLDVIIGRLRRKIRDNSRSPKYIHSVRGIGYKLLG